VELPLIETSPVKVTVCSYMMTCGYLPKALRGQLTNPLAWLLEELDSAESLLKIFGLEG
jgi:hypothetical protein